MGKTYSLAEFVEKLNHNKMIKITTSQNARGLKYLDRAKCFDVLKLMVFGLARVFQQSRSLSMILALSK
jgi:hypothetical protein